MSHVLYNGDLTSGNIRNPVGLRWPSGLERCSRSWKRKRSRVRISVSAIYSFRRWIKRNQEKRKRKREKRRLRKNEACREDQPNHYISFELKKTRRIRLVKLRLSLVQSSLVKLRSYSTEERRASNNRLQKSTIYISYLSC